MKHIPPEKWIPCDGIVLEDNADRAVRCDNHVLVIAGPGAGKTELLAQKAAYLLQTNRCKDPQKILAISFKAGLLMARSHMIYVFYVNKCHKTMRLQ